MREINEMSEMLEFCRALGSPARGEIVRYLAQNRTANLNELADALGVTNGAITAHIKILQNAGIIDVVNATGKRGLQKKCRLNEHKYMVNILSDYKAETMYTVELPVGSFIRSEAFPTCGIASSAALIGEVDDNRYFDDPRRTDAGIVWLSRGFLEYRIPNYLKAGATPREFQMSFEISSEAPGICEDWPSDIHFYLNDVLLGCWTSPGDFGTAKGLYTPEWWFSNWNQYGLLKLLTVNQEGSYIDGNKISDVNLSQFKLDRNSPLVFRFAAPETAAIAGGLTLFGKGFGNYNQDIRARVIFDEGEKSSV